MTNMLDVPAIRYVTATDWGVSYTSRIAALEILAGQRPDITAEEYRSVKLSVTRISKEYGVERHPDYDGWIFVGDTLEEAKQRARDYAFRAGLLKEYQPKK